MDVSIVYMSSCAIVNEASRSACRVKVRKRWIKKMVDSKNVELVLNWARVGRVYVHIGFLKLNRKFVSDK